MITVDITNIHIVERGIQPIMKKVITLPVLIQGKECGLAIYLTDMSCDVKNCDVLENIASRIAKKINTP